MLPEYVVRIKAAVSANGGYQWHALNTRDRSVLIMPIGRRLGRWPRTSRGAKCAWHNYAKRHEITDWSFTQNIDGDEAVQAKLWPSSN